MSPPLLTAVQVRAHDRLSGEWRTAYEIGVHRLNLNGLVRRGLAERRMTERTYRGHVRVVYEYRRAEEPKPRFSEVVAGRRPPAA